MQFLAAISSPIYTHAEYSLSIITQQQQLNEYYSLRNTHRLLVKLILQLYFELTFIPVKVM